MSKWIYMGLFCVSMLVGLSACNAQDPAYLEQLASEQEVNTKADVIINSDRIIDAPVNVVWEIMSDIDGWPLWNASVFKMEKRDIQAVSGNQFQWVYNDHEFVSTIGAASSPNVLSYSSLSGGHGIVSVWKFEEWNKDSTLVTVEQSVGGFFIAVFYDKEELKMLTEEWLEHLQSESKRRFVTEQ
ncbi:MAG: hypothetical protein O3A01_08215 [bacterium]|nr:hypothetical protein [bacterium]